MIRFLFFVNLQFQAISIAVSLILGDDKCGWGTWRTSSGARRIFGRICRTSRSCSMTWMKASSTWWGAERPGDALKNGWKSQGFHWGLNNPIWLLGLWWFLVAGVFDWAGKRSNLVVSCCVLCWADVSADEYPMFFLRFRQKRCLADANLCSRKVYQEPLATKACSQPKMLETLAAYSVQLGQSVNSPIA